MQTLNVPFLQSGNYNGYSSNVRIYYLTDKEVTMLTAANTQALGYCFHEILCRWPILHLEDSRAMAGAGEEIIGKMEPKMVELRSVGEKTG